MPWQWRCTIGIRAAIHRNARLAGLFVAAFLLLDLAGCSTSGQYRLSAVPTTPRTLDLHSEAVQASRFTLNSVIVPHGPGSWKEDALWDEYQFTAVNRGGQAVRLESAALVDEQGGS